MVWRMRVFFRVAICMVHPMQDTIRSGTQIRRTLPDIGEDVKKLLPISVHREHFMGCIPMQKKALTEKRKVPMR